MSNDVTPHEVGSHAGLGLVERLRQQFPDVPYHRDQLHRDAADEIERAWAARDAAVADLEAHAEAEVRRAVAAERERCAKPVPDEWLVKVRRLVQGFEHVSGIARLWEPDYSSGSERALWSRATEACADVAKLLREAEGPNAT